VSQVVQPHLGQPVLPQRLARLHHLLDEPARIPLRAGVRAFVVAEHKGGIPHELEGEQASGRSADAQGRDRVRDEVHRTRLAGLGRSLDGLLAGALAVTTPRLCRTCSRPASSSTVSCPPLV
jgi:hypothetical protein